MSVLLKKIEVGLGSKPQCYYASGSGNGYVADDCAALPDLIERNLKTVKICKNSAFQNGCIPDYRGLDDIVREENPGKPDDELNFGFCGMWNKTRLKRQTAYVLPDGTIIIEAIDSSLAFYSHFLFDVNGKKGPNKWGYDLFAFTLTSIHSKGDVLFQATTMCSGKKEKGGMLPGDMLKYAFLK